jgi:hypothetical protein
MNPQRIHWGPQDGKFCLYRGGEMVAAWPKGDWADTLAVACLSVRITGKAKVDCPTGTISLNKDEAARFVSAFASFAAE